MHPKSFHYQPCRVQGPPPKPKLSAEEARKQAEDMVRKAKERREVRPLAHACMCAHDLWLVDFSAVTFVRLAVTQPCCKGWVHACCANAFVGIRMHLAAFVSRPAVWT